MHERTGSGSADKLSYTSDMGVFDLNPTGRVARNNNLQSQSPVPDGLSLLIL